MRRSRGTGEAPLVSRVRAMTVVQNVTLGTLTGEIHLDAVIDTGSTLCVVPPIFACQPRVRRVRSLHLLSTTRAHYLCDPTVPRIPPYRSPAVPACNATRACHDSRAP